MRIKARLLFLAAAVSLFFILQPHVVYAQTGGFRGKIVVKNEDKPPGVKLRILAKGSYEPRTITSHPDGTITASGFRLGTWTLEVKTPGWQQVGTYTVEVVSNPPQSISPDPLSVKRPQSGPQTNGRTTLSGGTPMLTLVVYRVPEQQTPQPQLQSTETPKKLPPDTAVDFHGTVKSKGGEVLGDADVKLYVPDPQTGRLILVYKAPSDVKGSFDLPIGAMRKYKEYLIFIAHDRFETYSEFFDGGSYPPITEFLLGPKPIGPGIEKAEVERLDLSRRNIFQPRIIEALPLPGFRSFDALALLAPGVLPPPATYSTEGPGISPAVGTAGSFSVNGIRSRENNFTYPYQDWPAAKRGGSAA